MNFRLRTVGLVVGVCLGLLNLPLTAQSTATLRGTVTDESGAVVANASVTAHNQGTGVDTSTTTDSAGAYQVTALPPGNYTLNIQAPGFQKQSSSGLVLEVNRIVVQNFRLKVGNVSQEIVVTAETPVIETGTVTVGQVINERTVQEIPLNGRHFVDLGLLIPGSVTPPQNGFLTAPLRGQGSFAFNTAGQREDTVNYMINGINLNDMLQNQITFEPSINTVSEFKVDNSTYSAEMGRNSGAIVNIATRSGSNAWHGEGFEYLRNDALDARNFFNKESTTSGAFNPKAPFKRNNFGAALGGPIWKDHTFFFFSYEGLRQRQAVTINANVFSNGQRQQIQTAGNPSATKLLGLIPDANTGTNGFIGSSTAPVNIDQWTGDISHNFSQNDRLHGYYAIQRDKRQEPTLQYAAATPAVSGWGDTRQSRRQIFTLNEVHTFNSYITNEARLGFNRIHITFTPNQLLNPTDFGIVDGITTSLGIPQIAISDPNGVAFSFGGPATFPQGRGDLTTAASDTVSWLKGNHSFKFGGEFRRFNNNNFTGDAGTLVFNSITSFQNGVADQFNITPGSRPSRIYVNAAGVFAQDNWKFRPNFTLELGVRYDWNGTPTEAQNRFVVFDPATVSLIQVGTNGINSIYDQNHNVEPRVGFSWDLFGTGNTVLRAGYGYMVDQPVTNLVTPLNANLPFTNQAVFNGPGTIPLNNLLASAQGSGLAPNTINRHYRNADVQSWNLNVQQEVTPSLGLMVGYFGSKGTHLRVLRNINQSLNLASPTTSRPFSTLSANSPIKPPAGSLALGNITTNDSDSNSNYNALWVTANKRMSQNLQFNASYTWSKSLDYNSLNSQGAIVLQNSYDPRNNYGLSDFDARHRFVLNSIYDLPFKANRAVAGWELSGILQLQSGNPVTIVAPGPSFNNLTGTARATIRPDLVGSLSFPESLLSNGNIQWFTATVCNSPATSSCTFVIPTNPNHLGNVARNSIIGPTFKNLDFSVLKNTKITERLSSQFRAEFFDIFNHPNFGQPNRFATANSTTIGTITSTRFPTGDSGSSRQVQFAMKLIF